MHETLDPVNERRYVATTVVCHGCAAKAMKAEEPLGDYEKGGALYAVELPEP
jgi:hypothetical protein